MMSFLLPLYLFISGYYRSEFTCPHENEQSLFLTTNSSKDISEEVIDLNNYHFKECQDHRFKEICMLKQVMVKCNTVKYIHLGGANPRDAIQYDHEFIFYSTTPDGYLSTDTLSVKNTVSNQEFLDQWQHATLDLTLDQALYKAIMVHLSIDNTNKCHSDDKSCSLWHILVASQKSNKFFFNI